MAGKLMLKIAAGALSLCMIAAGTAVMTSADTLSDYQKRQQELDEAAAQYQAKIDSTASDIAQREEYKKALQSKITVLNEQISNGRAQIEALDIEIAGMQADIDESRGQISGRIDKLKQRVRALYLSGDTTSLEVILGAKDFGDFLDKVEILTYISRSDQTLIDSLQEDIEVINKKRDTLKEMKTELSNEQKNLDLRQKEMQTLIAQNEKLLDNLYEENSGAQDHLDETNEEKKKIEDQIQAYFKNKQAQEETARIASEAQKKLAEAKASSTVSMRITTYTSSPSNAASARSDTSSAGTSSQIEEDTEEDYYDPYEDDEPEQPSSEPESSRAESSSQAESSQQPTQVVTDPSDGYVWPVPGHYTLSSVWNEDRTTYNHGAIDISDGSIMNAQVVAADSGVVVMSNDDCTHNYGKDGSCGCGGGYGNYIMIDHGNGKATVYAHMTSLAVSSGDYVQKGQLVGYVGTTGWSTGPHLHFETRLDGEKYNPMNEYPNI